MVVPNRSGGTGNGTAIEIQILARDQASTILTQVQSGFNNVASSAAVASAKVTAMSVAIAALAGASLGKLAQVSQVFLGIKSALDTPVTRTVFDQIKQGAEESLKSTSSLSSVLSSVASVGGVAGQGFFGITKTSVIDDVESRFDKVSKKITGRLVDGFTNLPIEKLPLADKLLPPGVLEAAVGPLDKTLSDVIVGKVIGQKVPNALGGIFKRVAGQELGDTIAGTVRNSPLAGIASEPIKQLLGGSVLGAIESKISGTLSGAFKLGFVQADSFITAGATNLGLKVGTAILRQATGATAQNFALFDRLVGGQATKFVNNELPKLGKQAVEKSGAVQLVRTLSGELTNLISGSIVTGLTGGLAGGPATQAITQLLGDDLAAKGIKNLTGGVLVKVGEQVADITQLTFAARAGFEALFNVAASGVAKRLTGKLTASALGVIEGIIPPQIKQIFGVIEGLFPEQIADLREKLIDTIGSTVGGAIENFATAEVDRLQARAEELNAFLKNQGASTTPTQPVDTDFAQRLDLAEQADEARSRVADLRQEITELQNTPINLKDELVRIEFDTTLAPEDKQRLITDITSQIQAAEQALESPVEVLRSRLAELESVIAQTPVPAIQGEVPQALQQELNVAIESEDATSQISELRAELEELNATPLQLKEDLAAFEADSDLSSEALAKIREDITKELANTEKAIAPRVAEINQDIARLGKIADAAPRSVNEVLGDIASARRTIPIDSDEVVAARERLVDLGTELQALQDRPEILKEELIRVQLDAEIPDDQRRELVASLTQDIQSAAEAIPDAIARIQGEMASLQGTIDTSTPIGTRTVAPTPDGDNSILVEQFEAAERARAEIAGVREELARLEAEPVALKEQLVQVTLDTEIPDDQKQELVTNLTRDIREAELALRDPITQIQAQIESLNEVIGRSPQTVDQVVGERIATPDAAESLPAPEPLSPEDIEAFNRAQVARQEIAGLRQELQKLAAMPSALKRQREDVQIFSNANFREKLVQLNQVNERLSQARASQDALGVAAAERELSRIEVVLFPDLKPAEKQNFVKELNAQIKDAEGLLQAPVVQVQTQLITAQEKLQNLPEDAEQAKQLKKEIVALETELSAFESRPIEIKEQLVQLELDTTIPPDQKGKLASSLQQELNAAESVLANPVARIQQQIIELNSIASTAPISLPGEPQSASAVDNFEAVDNARTELAAIEAQVAEINSKPIQLRAELERVQLDTTISDEDKAALTEGLLSQITQAEAAIQSPLQRLARTIVGVVAGASEESGGTLIVDVQKIFGQLDDFLEGTLSEAFTEIGSNAAKGFAKGLGDSIFQEIAPILDSVDGFILGTIDKIKNIPGQFTEPLGQISNAFTAVAGVNEPLALFEGIQEKAGQAFGAIAKVGEQITFFQSGFDTLRTLVTNGPFELLIGQNIRLNEQLLSTKASLISTNKIVDGFSGDEVVATAAQKSDPNNPISDQQAQIMALDAPVNAAIAKIRKGSQELAGVTSSQLIEGFQVVAQNASAVGLSLQESADTSLSFAAALGTLGVPLEQARQEVTSILTAQISSDSVVAKSLGITNEQVRLYKSQGKIFEFLEGKLKGFREGNKLAAQSIAGVTSNIQEIFENIALEAGKPLLKPIVDELTKIEDFLTANQAGITAAVSDVALNLFEGIKAAFDALKVVGGALQGILTQLPIYLFESLSNFLKIAAESAITTIKALEPMISVFTQLFEVIRPLAGPFLQIAVQAKALQVGIGALGGSFGFLANLLPGVGDLLFGVSARTLPMVNLFPALAGGLGQGAAGFLLLGQNMNSIPGLAGQVAARLGAFGPLGPVIAGLIPSIAGVGITIAGLARNFPPLQAGINKIFAANPADLVSGLKAFTGFIPGLSLLNPLLDSASDRLRVVAGNQSLSAFATAQFETALRAAGVQLRNFVVSTALLGAGLFLAFQAVDKFILKNEQLIEVIKGTVEGIQNTLGVLAQFATNPFFTGISVTIGVAIIAANGLHLALLRLVATQVAGWAGAVAGGLSQLAKFLSLIRLGAMAQGAIQASVGLQGLAIAMTQGSAASAQFLAANGINVVTLGTLQASLTATVARIRLFIITTLQSAGTLAKNFVASVLAASSALFSSLLKAIPAAIAGLRATRATATGTSFSFVGLATSIKATSTAMIGGIIGAAKGVVASLVAMATGAGGGAIAFGTLATSIGTTIAGLAVLLAPIVAVVAAIASIGLLVQAKRISDSTAAVEKQGEATNTAFDSALQTAQKLKSVREDQEKRTSNGIELTKEEYAANQQLLKQAQEQQSQLDKQIASLEKSKKDTVGDANKGNIDAQIEQLKKAKETLTSFSSDIQLAPKDLPRLGSTFEQLAEKAKSAQEAVNNSSGDPEIFKQKSQELIEITQQQLEQNQINAEEARARLDDLAGNANVDAETQIKAQQAITESYKAESQKQIDAKSAADEKIKAGIESGRVREIEGEKQLTASRIEQTNLQLEAAQKAHDERLRLLDKERAKTLKFLETELATRQKDATAKVGTKDEDSATKAVEQTQNKITALETANNQQRANLEQQFGAERDKLQAEQERNITEGAKREQEIRLKAVEKANKTATDALTKAQNDRLISTQKLVNAGVLSQEQAEERKVKATAQSNAAQIQAETKRQSELEALIKSAPTAKAREELELQLRESRLKSQDLTLKSLETEAQAQQAHIATVKAGLEKQGNTELLAIEKRVNAGIATEAEAGDARADQRVRSLTAEINLEKAGSAKRLALELELQSAIRAARESESAKRKEELQNVQTAEQIALEKRINEGLASETEAADLTADQRVAQIQQELSLEGLSKTERLNLELELQRAIRGARESESAKRKAELEDEQNVELLAIEKRINTGAATEAQAGRLRASGRVAQLQAELELEGQSKSDRLKLQIELEQAIRAEQEATLAERREKLEQVNQVAQNQIEAENQKLNQQKLVYDTITQAMENRNRLIQAGANLIKAQADFQVAELNVLAQGEKSEFRKRQLTEITAAIRLRALIQQQAFDRESLAAEQERNRLAIENEKIQNRIAIGEQKANIASARADLEVARLDPKTTAPALEALQLKLQAEVDKGGFLEEQTGLIDQKGAINDRELAIKQAQQRFEQRSALRGAQSELVEALPPGQRNRARRELQQNISEDLGAENYQDLRNKGLASSRQLVNQQFGTGVTKPVDFDAEAFDMQRQLAGVRREFGAAAVTPAAGAIVPVGTQPLALPPVELAGLGATFQNSGQMFVSGIDRLVKALDGGVAGGQSINVSLTTGGVTQNRAIATTTQTQQPSIENVVGFAKQLLGI